MPAAQPDRQKPARPVPVTISISDPAQNRSSTRNPPSLRAFLEMGFRPLYAAGAAWALISILVWTFAPHWTASPLVGVTWHAHEMLWGFIGTIAVGFLMTAGATWTGINPLRGWPLGLALALWLVARIGFLAGGTTAFLVAAACEVIFFALAAGLFLRAVHRSRNRRNYAVPWLIVALAVADVLYLYAAYRADYVTLMHHFNSGLLVMAIIALLVARRVIPFFAMRRIAGLAIPMHTRSGQVQLAACALAIVCSLLQVQPVAALALAVAGLIALWQWLAWKPLAVRSEPLLWILYVGYAMLGAGLLAAALHAGGFTLRSAIHVHIIAVGGFAVLIIGMLTRTALGHLGRPLALDNSMRLSYALMLLAVVLRLAALIPSVYSSVLLQFSTASWVACFALYLWRFVPMLIRQRLP